MGDREGEEEECRRLDFSFAGCCNAAWKVQGLRLAISRCTFTIWFLEVEGCGQNRRLPREYVLSSGDEIVL